MATHWTKEDYKSTRKKFKSNRQCTWILPSGKRCSKKACGYFFCKEHLTTATSMESGLMYCEMGRML